MKDIITGLDKLTEHEIKVLLEINILLSTRWYEWAVKYKTIKKISAFSITSERRNELFSLSQQKMYLQDDLLQELQRREKKRKDEQITKAINYRSQERNVGASSPIRSEPRTSNPFNPFGRRPW
jgi:hypothetical protein